MHCNIEKYVLQHRKTYTATLKKYVLQHRKLCTATSQAVLLQHHKNICCNDPKIPLQHSKIICCNIQKKPLQHGRNNKKKHTKTAPAPSPLSSPKEGGNRTPEFTETLATAASLRSEEEEEDE
jgi:hypothetical protein